MRLIDVQYNGPLILLSTLIALVVAYIAFDFVHKAAGPRGLRNKWWIFAAALTLGVGLWSSDFVGLFALEGPIQLHFSLLHSLTSVIPGVCLSSAAFWLAARRYASLAHAVSGGTLLGFSIVATYFLVMQAIDYRVYERISTLPVLLAALFAFLGATGAVTIHLHSNRRQRIRRRKLLLTAALFAVGVAAMRCLTDTSTRFYWFGDDGVSAGVNASINRELSGAIIGVALFTIVLVVVTSSLLRGRLEQMIYATEQDYRDILKQQQGMTFKFLKIDHRFIHTFCDGELVYKMGHTPAMVVGHSLDEFLDDELQVQNKLRYYERAWNGEDVTYHGQIGGIVYLASLRPIRHQGKVVEVIASCVDITELYHAREALQQSEEKYRIIAEHTWDLIRVLDRAGSVVYASPSHLRVLGYHPEQLLGKNASFFIHPEDLPRIEAAISRMASELKETFLEYRCLHAHGHTLWFESSIVPVANEHGAFQMEVVVSRDVTDRRVTEDALRRTEKMMLAGQLAAGVAHEIRNPLTAIQGFVDLLKHEDNGKNRRYLNIIRSEIEQIDQIIKEFLLLAKPQTREKEPVDLRQLVTEVVMLLMPQANLKNVQLRMAYDELPTSVRGSDNHLKQVFVNLVKNAIEASPDGGQIRIDFEDVGSNVVIRIADDGPGVPQSLLNKLGEPFYTTKDRGTGLGLMVSFQIVRDHGGDIQFHSSPSSGTTVQVSLPRILDLVMSPTS